MVANTTIAAEGFKKITVKFLCEQKEPEVHRFEYEQGMLFLTIPKWIQKKLRNLKKKIDFNKQPFVKVSVIFIKSRRICPILALEKVTDR